MYGRYDVIKYLLSSGADFTLCDVDGKSPSIAASSSGYTILLDYSQHTEPYMMNMIVMHSLIHVNIQETN
jgi:ankyrin repeat protein